MISVDSYRAALVGWRDAAIARSKGRSVLALEEQRENCRSMQVAGLAGPSWTVRYGGAGGDDRHEVVFDEVLGSHSYLLTPRLVTYGICAPTILDFGTEEQRMEFLPDMIAGVTVWAQLLSEPGAGSDLASVSVHAKPAEGGWSLSGQKVWTSRADIAGFALALVRTGDIGGSNRRKALSMMIIDMSADGIDIRPLREMTGEAVFNEVFLDDVFVPKHRLLGELNGGWAVLLGMLHHERDAVGATTAANTIYRMRSQEFIDRVAGLEPRSVSELQHDFVRLIGREHAHLALADAVANARRAHDDQRPFGSLLKVSMSMLASASVDLSARIEGMAMRTPSVDGGTADAALTLLRAPMSGIAGGTTEIQKNTIAKRVLLLSPKDGRR